MTDLKKRKSLKALSVVSLSVAAAPVMAAATASISTKPALGIELKNVAGQVGELILTNPLSRPVSVTLGLDQDIEVPGGVLQREYFSALESVEIAPGSRHSISIRNRGARKYNIEAGNHASLRFPVTDNVLLGQVLVNHSNGGLNPYSPLYLI